MIAAMTRGLFAIALLLVPPCLAEEAVKNWFDDPYFQVRSAIAHCPTPLGPFTTHEQMLKETHYRSERGTRCWLEGKCSKPSSYMYDADIAQAVRARFEGSPKLKDASLWVTVQRRFVWIDGCVRSARGRNEIETLLRGVPDVEMLIVNVMRAADAAPPYRTLAPRQP